MDAVITPKLSAAALVPSPASDGAGSALLALAQSAPCQRALLPECDRRGVELRVLRLDLIDAAAPGNKLFKLWNNLEAARAQGQRCVLSFGGAYSNHLHALAHCANQAGLTSIGVIRGEPSAAANPTLQDAARLGMTLHFVDRASYRRREEPAFLATLKERFGDFYGIPEGGSNALGAAGCRAIGTAIRGWPQPPQTVALACATGATLAGVAAGLNDSGLALGIAVLKGDFLNALVTEHLHVLGAAGARWRLDNRFHGGGYARVSSELAQFCTDFSARTQIEIEPIYTGKMLYALCTGIKEGEFARGSSVLALHTGGLQGARGLALRAQGALLAPCGES